MTPFADVFGRYVTRSHYTSGQLAALSGVPKRTIANWLGRQVIRPQRWQPILRAAIPLHLNRDEVNLLLESAGKPQISQLAKTHGNTPDRSLLEPWLTQRHTLQPLVRPRRLPSFKGRTSELTQLKRTVKAGETITICGPGGMGKTALISEYVWQLAPAQQLPARFSDGIFFYSFYDRPETNVALEALARAFGEDPLLSTSKAAAARAVGGKKALIVWDGVEVAERLSDVLSISDYCAVILTTRRRSDAPSTLINLNPLQKADGIKLLNHLNPALVSQPEKAHALCEAVGYLPLAVHLIGRYLFVHQSLVDDYLAWLEDAPMQALDQGEQQQNSVPLILERTLRSLNPQGVRLLKIFGALALRPVPEPLIKALCHGNTGIFHQAIGTLINWGLVVKDSQTYSLRHPLIHNYLSNTTSPDSDQFQTTIDWLKHVLTPDTISIDDDNLRAHLIPLATSMVKAGLDERLLEFAQSLINLNLNGGHLQDKLAFFEVVHAASKNHGQLEGELWAGRRLAQLLFSCGQLTRSETLFRSVLARTPDDRTDQKIKILMHLGSLLNSLGQFEEAIETLQAAHILNKTVSDPYVEAKLQIRLCQARRELGHFPQAFDHIEASLSIAKHLEHETLIVDGLLALSVLYHRGCHWQSAYDTLQEAIEIARRLKNEHSLMLIKTNLSFVLIEAGQSAEAYQHLSGVLEMSQNLGNHLSEAYALCNIAHIHRFQSRWQRAADYYLQALAIFRSIDSWHGQVTQLGNLSWVYSNMGDIETSLGYADQMMVIAKSAESIHQIFSATLVKAIALRKAGSLDQSQALLNSLITGKDAAPYQRLAASAEIELAEIFWERGQQDKAVGLFEKGLATFRKNNSSNHERAFSIRLLALYQALGDEEAIKRLSARIDKLDQKIDVIR